MKRHSDLTSADISKKKTDQIMTEFMTNIQSQKPDWKENIAHEDESNKNAEVSDENDQFEISLNEKFEKKDEEEEKSKETAESSIMLDQ